MGHVADHDVDAQNGDGGDRLAREVHAVERVIVALAQGREAVGDILHVGDGDAPVAQAAIHVAAIWRSGSAAAPVTVTSRSTKL